MTALLDPILTEEFYSLVSDIDPSARSDFIFMTIVVAICFYDPSQPGLRNNKIVSYEQNIFYNILHKLVISQSNVVYSGPSSSFKDQHPLQHAHCASSASIKSMDVSIPSDSQRSPQSSVVCHEYSQKRSRKSSEDSMKSSENLENTSQENFHKIQEDSMKISEGSIKVLEDSVKVLEDSIMKIGQEDTQDNQEKSVLSTSVSKVPTPAFLSSPSSSSSLSSSSSPTSSRPIIPNRSLSQELEEKIFSHLRIIQQRFEDSVLIMDPGEQIKLIIKELNE